MALGRGRDDDYNIRIYNIYEPNIYYTLKGHKDTVNTIKYIKQNNILISASRDKTIKIWNFENQ